MPGEVSPVAFTRAEATPKTRGRGPPVTAIATGTLTNNANAGSPIGGKVRPPRHPGRYRYGGRAHALDQRPNARVRAHAGLARRTYWSAARRPATPKLSAGVSSMKTMTVSAGMR